MKPRKGHIYTHRKFFDPVTKRPLRCKVTKVAKGIVYYRGYYGVDLSGDEVLGGLSFFDVEDAPKVFQEIEQ